MQILEITREKKVYIRRMEWRGKDVLDVRTFIISRRYTGYTREGIRIPFERAEELMDALAEEILGGE